MPACRLGIAPPGPPANSKQHKINLHAQPPCLAPTTPPRSTLFVGNLADNVNELELKGVFGPQPGFRQLKVVRNTRAVTAFVEYDTVEQAQAVHGSLQGAVLPSSDRGGMRIQFSKNPFGRRVG